MERDGLSGFELAVLAAGGLATIVVGATWGGASLSLLVSGRPSRVPLGVAAAAVGRLPSHGADPAAAWPVPLRSTLPGPTLYWFCTLLVVGAMAVAVGLGVRWFGGSKVGTSKRRPLGVDARPGFAAARPGSRT